MESGLRYFKGSMSVTATHFNKKTLMQSINSPANILNNENVNKASYDL